MSELMNAQNNRRGFRRNLLATASVAALLLTNVETGNAAENFFTSSDRPPFWIELGGEADQMSGGMDSFIPSFTQNPGSLAGGNLSPIAQKAPVFSYGAAAKISYQPEGSDWILAASIRYGRALRHRVLHTQTVGRQYPPIGAFYNAGTEIDRNHLLVDFQAGKDVGLGMFGEHAHATFSAGVRFVQFTSKSSSFISSAPTLHDFFSYREKNTIDRSSMAIGPSIAWDASVPVIGRPNDGLSLDWGANAAILFGRQKVDFSGQSRNTHYVTRRSAPIYSTSTSTGFRKKTVTIPNVGGFVGLSFRRPAAKVSLGYRADMYFGAIDAGFVNRRSSNQSFYGPFLTVGIGIGR